MNEAATTATQPTARADRGEQVASHIACELLSGCYHSGDHLPGEIELAEQLGVSRASIRSGLQILATLGMIRRQVGHGTVVQDKQEWNLLDARVSQWMIDHGSHDAELIRAVHEYRRAIEPYVSALAATRATSQDLARIEQAFERMRASVDEDSSEHFTAADVAFHTAIYQATHNLIWRQSANILQPAILLVIQTSNATASELGDSLSRHAQVLEAIRLRRPEAAFAAASHVLERTASDLGVATDTALPVLSLTFERESTAGPPGSPETP